MQKLNKNSLQIKSLLLLVIAGLFSLAIHANVGEISLNNNTVKILGEYALTDTGLVIEASALHNQDRGTVLSIGGIVFGNAGEQGLDAGLGVKLAYVDPDISIPAGINLSSPSGTALALGGKVSYIPANYNRINVGAYLWFAPDVLSFDKLDKYQEIGVYAGYNVLRNADVFIGYHNVQAGFKNFGDGTIDTGLHIGIRATF